RDANDFYYSAVIQAAGVVDPRAISSSLVVSRGDVSAKIAIRQSLILANGNVTTEDIATRSVIICDGDVLVTTRASACLIIARGKIEIKGSAVASTLIAGGTVTVAKLPKLPEIQIAENDPNARVKLKLALAHAEAVRVEIKEKEPNPLGFITFFELRQIGLEVKAVDGAVQVTKVAGGKPCEKAGLKVGDTILEVNGKKPTDAESLRRLLRDALAIADATVKFQRGDKTETLKVALPE
ncbi:MAG: PDZ domain-containing protein, partial [Planctomycetia bacterium]|nr:PDZ domain-containing protein [Planctomycetia bacterium]